MLRVVGHLLCLYICCRVADGLTETLVELGQNATIKCSLNTESAYWYIQHQPQPPLAILRSFTSSSSAAFYYNSNFRQKYYLLTEYRLLIQNVTVDDCGVYYCAKKEEGRLIFNNGTRLMTTEVYADYPNKTNQTSSYPNQTSSYPNQTSSYPNQTSSCRSSWENCLLSIYSVLNAILMVMILLLILTLPCQNRNTTSKLTPRRRVDQRGLLPVCLILLIGQVSSQDEVEGFMSENVILPCLYQTSIQEVNIFWECGDDKNKNVYYIMKGKANLTGQDRQFRDRTRMFPDEWTNGNFSLLLTDLKDTDSGSYSCFIQTKNVLHQVTLSVKEKPSPNSSSLSIRGQNLSPFLFLLLSQTLHVL